MRVEVVNCTPDPARVDASTSAAVSAPDPPTMTGQPTVCAYVPRASPTAELPGVSSRVNACAAMPWKRGL